MRVALAQINPVLGDFEFNLSKIEKFTKQSEEYGVDLVIFPELSVCGYPPEDLLHNGYFVESAVRCISKLKNLFQKTIGIVGGIDLNDSIIFNTAFLIHRDIVLKYYKTRLPNYSVFDENRYFGIGDKSLVVNIPELKINLGLSICEDIWYPDGVVHDEVTKLGADVIVNISSSPYYIGKSLKREEMIKVRARDYISYILYVNIVGGQDELVFDGGSLVVSPDGEILARGKQFEEDLVIVDIDPEVTIKKRLIDPRRRFLVDIYRFGCFYKLEKVSLGYSRVVRERTFISNKLIPKISENEELIRALELAIRDYVKKSGFDKVVIGISGGIDSALVAFLCTEALGKDKVLGVSMPSRFSSEATRNDTKLLCQNLGIELIEINIEKVFNEFLNILEFYFRDRDWDITEENLQARIRGNILMAISNKFNRLVVSTGNKSELSMGYSTLYGDMVGGFALIKDLYKTTIYKLAEYINEKCGFDIIPRSIIERPPSAELKENQKDEDTLPPYSILDQVLERYIENESLPEEIFRETGIDISLVKEIINTVNKNEYKRRQGPLGVKITERSFGKDRRYPIVNRFIV